MTSVYNQETATAMYLREQREIAKKEGIKEGIEQGLEQGVEQGKKEGLFQGKLDLLVEMVKEKIITISDAAKRIGLSEREFLKMVKQYVQDMLIYIKILQII